MEPRKPKSTEINTPEAKRKPWPIYPDDGEPFSPNADDPYERASLIAMIGGSPMGLFLLASEMNEQATAMMRGFDIRRGEDLDAQEHLAGFAIESQVQKPPLGQAS